MGLRPVVLRPLHGARAEIRSFRHYRRDTRACRNRLLAASRGGHPASGVRRHHAADRGRSGLAGGLPVCLGRPQFLFRPLAATACFVGRAVADHGRGAGVAVAAEARHHADDGELPRSDPDRSRHRGVPVHDLSEPALERGRRRDRHSPADVRAVAARSVPDPPPAGGRFVS